MKTKKMRVEDEHEEDVKAEMIKYLRNHKDYDKVLGREMRGKTLNAWISHNGEIVFQRWSDNIESAYPDIDERYSL